LGGLFLPAGTGDLKPRRSHASPGGPLVEKTPAEGGGGYWEQPGVAELATSVHWEN